MMTAALTAVLALALLSPPASATCSDEKLQISTFTQLSDFFAGTGNGRRPGPSLEMVAISVANDLYFTGSIEAGGSGPGHVQIKGTTEGEDKPIFHMCPCDPYFCNFPGSDCTGCDEPACAGAGERTPHFKIVNKPLQEVTLELINLSLQGGRSKSRYLSGGSVFVGNGKTLVLNGVTIVGTTSIWDICCGYGSFGAIGMDSNAILLSTATLFAANYGVEMSEVAAIAGGGLKAGRNINYAHGGFSDNGRTHLVLVSSSFPDGAGSVGKSLTALEAALGPMSACSCFGTERSRCLDPEAGAAVPAPMCQCISGTFFGQDPATLEFGCYGCPAGRYGMPDGILAVLGNAGVEQGCPGLCKAGTHSERVGAVSADECSDAPCPSGKWSAITGLSSVEGCQGDCPTGRYSASTGLSSVDDCDESACPIGKFGLNGRTPSSERVACDLCPGGRRGKAEGASSMEDGCAPCDLGKTSGS